MPLFKKLILTFVMLGSSAFSSTFAQGAYLPQVALVLGGGGAKGAAYVGVLRSLEEAGVPIDLIAGNSAGSIAGGFYAAGLTPDSIEEIYKNIQPTESGRLVFPLRGGLLEVDGFEALLEGILEGRKVTDTDLPFFPAAAELDSNTFTTLRDAPLSRAIRASMSVPGLFNPVKIGKEFYFDAGIVGNVPAGLARDEGADYILAFCLSEDPLSSNTTNPLLNVLGIYYNVQKTLNAIQRRAANRLECIQLPPGGFLNFSSVEEFAQIGYQATQKALPRILADLEKKGIPLLKNARYNVGKPINVGWKKRLEAARLKMLIEPQPLSFGVRFSLEPQGYFSHYTAGGYKSQSLVRAAISVSDGFLGQARAELGYATDFYTNSQIDAALEYRPDLKTTFAARGFWGGTLKGELEANTQWGNVDFLARARFPASVLDLSGVYKTGNLRFELGGGGALDLVFVRAYADARGSFALSKAFTIHARGFYGIASPQTPALEGFSVGQRTGLRGYGPESGRSLEMGVGNLELEWKAPSLINLSGAAFVKPSLWVFGDIAAVQGYASPLTALGVGAGLEGYALGFFPFDIGLDVGYGFPGGGFSVGLRTRVIWP